MADFYRIQYSKPLNSDNTYFGYKDIDARREKGTPTDKSIIDFLASNRVNKYICSSTLNFESGVIMANIDFMINEMQKTPKPTKDALVNIASRGMNDKKYMTVLVCGLFIVKILKDYHYLKETIVFEQVKRYMDGYTYLSLKKDEYRESLLSDVFNTQTPEEKHESEELQKVKERVEKVEDNIKIHNEYFAGEKTLKQTDKETKNLYKEDDNNDKTEAQILLTNNEFMQVMVTAEKNNYVQSEGWRFEWKDTKRNLAHFVRCANKKFNLYAKGTDGGNNPRINWQPFEKLFKQKRQSLKQVFKDIKEDDTPEEITNLFN
ncbi:hypothetical protein J6G99_07840 [bacterium]|nr:hypothetical protein [Bacteroidales bacterium]MBP3821537.1 hypothetical protein [bacterium]